MKLINFFMIFNLKSNKNQILYVILKELSKADNSFFIFKKVAI